MKKLLLNANICMISAIFCVACSKDPSNPNAPASATGSIQYKVNGTLVSFDNKNILSGEGAGFAKQLKGLVPETRYLLNAQKGVNNALGFTIIADSLHETSYHYDSASVSNQVGYFEFVAITAGQGSGLLLNGDYFDVTITSYKDGRISGTFNGRQTPISIGGGVGIAGSVIISEGVINNVPVTY